MAKYIVIDKVLFGIDGTVPLFRKDDWKLSGKIVENIGDCERTLDLSGYDVTAFLPAASGGNPLSFPVTLVSASFGRFELNVPKEASSGVALAKNGTSLYFTLDNTSDNISTVETPFEPLEIRDREFREY